MLKKKKIGHTKMKSEKNQFCDERVVNLDIETIKVSHFSINYFCIYWRCWFKPGAFVLKLTALTRKKKPNESNKRVTPVRCCLMFRGSCLINVQKSVHAPLV